MENIARRVGDRRIDEKSLHDQLTIIAKTNPGMMQPAAIKLPIAMQTDSWTTDRITPIMGRAMCSSLLLLVGTCAVPVGGGGYHNIGGLL